MSLVSKWGALIIAIPVMIAAFGLYVVMMVLDAVVSALCGTVLWLIK